MCFMCVNINVWSNEASCETYIVTNLTKIGKQSILVSVSELNRTGRKVRTLGLIGPNVSGLVIIEELGVRSILLEIRKE